MTNTEIVWTKDIEDILQNIRKNCVTMSKIHKNRHVSLKGTLRYFRIPIIVLSGLNSVIAVGLQPYLEQGVISVATCLISLTCGIIGSIELYLAIQTQMETELIQSKEYYILSIEIYKVLHLDVENRTVDGKIFLDDKFAIYEKLIEKSNIINKKYEDFLTPIEKPKKTIFGFSGAEKGNIIQTSSTSTSTSTSTSIQSTIQQPNPTAATPISTPITSPRATNQNENPKDIDVELESMESMSLDEEKGFKLNLNLKKGLKNLFHTAATTKGIVDSNKFSSISSALESKSVSSTSSGSN
jgi:hypothetical protein